MSLPNQKVFHVFCWWIHLEEAGNDIPYDGSYETFQDAIDYLSADDQQDGNLIAQIFQTQEDGSLKLLFHGDNRRGKWEFTEIHDAT